MDRLMSRGQRCRHGKLTDRSVPLKPTIHHILCRNERHRSILSAVAGRIGHLSRHPICWLKGEGAWAARGAFRG